MPGKRLVQFEKVPHTPEIQGRIGQQLKAQYDVAEPIPDRLAELLKQLAQLELLTAEFGHRLALGGKSQETVWRVHREILRARSIESSVPQIVPRGVREILDRHILLKISGL